MDKISRFINEYFFLSNFYPAKITYLGITYNNNEAAFQAQKTSDKTKKIVFSSLSASDAKRRGRKLKLIEGWDEIKTDIMYEICKAKFDQNPDIKQLLLNTGNTVLEEGNQWGDKIWGTSNGVGENRLGKILMSIREGYLE